jgi:histidine triad (HIT) family protein
MADDCLFCKIAAGEIPSNQVYSDDEFYAFRDIHPAAPVHVLIIPRKHIERIIDANEKDAALLGRMILRANQVAEAEGIAQQGVRYVINCNAWAGQEVFHIHLHIVGGRPLGWPPG